MYSKLFSECLIMTREALDYPTMDNKQNTTVKTTPQPVVTPVGLVFYNPYQSFISSIEIT